MIIKTHEQQSGSAKPFHLTGEVNATEVFNRLTSEDRSNLQTLLGLLFNTARTHNIMLHILLAGSAASLGASYRDIDLWVHTKPLDKGLEFAGLVKATLKEKGSISVSTTSDRFSSIFMRELQTPYTMMVQFVDNNHQRSGVAFDISVAESRDRTYDDILTFHRTNNLAFCELPILETQ